MQHVKQKIHFEYKYRTRNLFDGTMKVVDNILIDGTYSVYNHIVTPTHHYENFLGNFDTKADAIKKAKSTLKSMKIYKK